MKEVVIIIDGGVDEEYTLPFSSTLLNQVKVSYQNHCVEKEAESLSSILTIMNFSPPEIKGLNRSYFEGLAHGVNLQDDEVIFRCNLIKIDSDFLVDFTSGLSEQCANELSKKYQLTDKNFYAAQGYRNLVIFKNRNIPLIPPPHQNIGKSLLELWSTIHGSVFEKWMFERQKEFQKVNLPYGFYLWGGSKKASLPTYFQRFNKTAGMVCGIDLLDGLSKVLQMKLYRNLSLTGDEHTNLSQKRRFAEQSIEENEITYVHINGADELAHRHLKNEKNQFILKVEQELILPILEKFPFVSITITCDHITSSEDGQHHVGKVPLLTRT